MRYLPHTKEDIASMLEVVGVDSLDDLFSSIPKDCRRPEELNLPAPLTEWELRDLMASMAGRMAEDHTVYIGAGNYEHYIPESVFYLLGRSEFSTAYTPYQPELSQGTLQAIFEFQTLISRLLGMEAANASMYDGASALAEALLMAIRVSKKRNKVAVSKAIHPTHRKVVETYFAPTEYEIEEIPYLPDGRTDLSVLEGRDDLAGVAIQSPNFFGCIEDLGKASDLIHAAKGLLVAHFTEPMAYGLLKSPGSLGADIACGEGQSLGVPQSFGGPGLGLMAANMKYIRNIPGRLIGQTVDADGKRGFVLTLATREQHIRREKAVSNICTNNSLNALTSSMYMASVGSTGIRELAQLNYDKAEYLKGELLKAGCEFPFSSPTFNEFVVKLKGGREAYERLLKEKIVAGLPLGDYYPELDDCYLMCVTETRTKDDLDALVRGMA